MGKSTRQCALPPPLRGGLRAAAPLKGCCQDEPRPPLCLADHSGGSRAAAWSPSCHPSLSHVLFFSSFLSSQLDPQTVESKNWHTDVIEMNGVSWRERACLHSGWAARPLAGVLRVLPAPVPVARPLSLLPTHTFLTAALLV